MEAKQTSSKRIVAILLLVLGLILHHVERMRQIGDSLYALAEIKEEAQ